LIKKSISGLGVIELSIVVVRPVLNTKPYSDWVRGVVSHIDRDKGHTLRKSEEDWWSLIRIKKDPSNVNNHANQFHRLEN